MKKLQLTFNQKYTTTSLIGASQTSEVYLGIDNTTQKQYAIKLQPISNINGQLQRQSKIYRVLKDGVGFPNLYWYGVQHQYRVLVTDVYGPSLQQLLEYCDGKFSLKTALLIFDQILDRIHWIHSKKFIHNDICPQNFLIGLRQKADKIFIVDFGNSKKYVDDKYKHIQLTNDNSPFVSDIRFKSVHAHIKKSTKLPYIGLSRRDDLQSLGYMIIYLLKGTLPWQQLPTSSQQSLQTSTKQSKVSIPTSLLCQNLPQQFHQYFSYIRSLQFQQQPDYIWIKRIFNDLFQQLGYTDNRVMDWAKKHQH